MDTEGVDLSGVARSLYAEHGAGPAVVLGAARRGSASTQIEGLPLRVAVGWRFGWGAAGKLWSVTPPGADAPESPPATAHAIFDLASLTKPVTALLVARLQLQGVLDRQEHLADLLPEAKDTASADMSLDMLTAHRAGLQDHVELFVKQPNHPQPSRERIIFGAANARRPECAGDAPSDGFPPVYSDLGYILVGEAIAARANKPLDELVAHHIAKPLGLTLGSARYLEKNEPMAKARMVPTEEVDWRGGVLRGVVHDENAWALAGAASAGHAGLFADVWSIVRLGTSILDAADGRKDRWLPKSALEPLIARRPGGSHTAGFDTRSADTSSMGAIFGPNTFGHLGFTGTSLWMDPDRDLVGVLLTNRVHPTRDNTSIQQIRPIAYDSMAKAMGA